MPINFELLRSIDLFQSLSDEDQKKIAGDLQIRYFVAQRTFLNANSSINSIFLILEGQVQASIINQDGHVVSMQILRAGDSIGWLSFMDGKPNSKNYKTLQKSKLLIIPISLARKLYLQHHSFTNHIVKQLTSALRLADQERVMHNLPRVEQKIYTQILLMHSFNQSAKQPEPLPKQHDLAAMVNTSRETVSRALKKLVTYQIAIKNGHKMYLKDPQALHDLIQESHRNDASV